MPAWLSVYCTRSVAHVTAEDLLASISEMDLHTIAEGFGIEDEAIVDAAVSALRIEPVLQLEGVKFRLLYRPKDSRPVFIYVSVEPAEVRELRDEVLEELAPSKARGVRRVRSHLARVIEVAALELVWNQLDDMGIVLAGQVAEYLAVVGKGLIQDHNDDWWAMRGRAPVLIVGPKKRGEPGATADRPRD